MILITTGRTKQMDIYMNLILAAIVNTKDNLLTSWNLLVTNKDPSAYATTVAMVEVFTFITYSERR